MKSGQRQSGRQSGWAFAAALAALALAGCESMYEAQAVREHPVPGRLVAVEEGRRIHIDCRGTGSPTVVFQSGGDLMGALGWQPVMQ